MPAFAKRAVAESMLFRLRPMAAASLFGLYSNEKKMPVMQVTF
jgi:hypothetical protein